MTYIDSNTVQNRLEGQAPKTSTLVRSRGVFLLCPAINCWHHKLTKCCAIVILVRPLTSDTRVHAGFRSLLGGSKKRVEEGNLFHATEKSTWKCLSHSRNLESLWTT